MRELRLYVSDDVAERIEAGARARNQSASHYLAELVTRDVAAMWPDGFFDEVVGGWRGEALARSPQSEYEVREWTSERRHAG